MNIRPTNYQTQIKIFEMAGCQYIRTKGDHLIYHYPGAIRPVIIPKYKEVCLKYSMLDACRGENGSFQLLYPIPKSHNPDRRSQDRITLYP